MNSVRIEFLDGTPDGPRKVRDSNWSGECILCSRSRMNDAIAGDLLDKPGVYVLLGPSKAKEVDSRILFETTIYIGQGDSVQERLQSHLRNKEFWRTAVVFRRDPDLHAGNIKYLEAKLIELATKAGNCVLANSVSPSLPSLPPAERADTEEFFSRMLFFLAALGFDFFSAEEPVVEPPTTEKTPGEAPQYLREIVESLKAVVATLPNTEFYTTRSPDSRAKVTNGNDFRVFARLKYRKSGIKLLLKDVGEFDISGAIDVTPHVIEQIGVAHSKADEYLSSR